MAFLIMRTVEFEPLVIFSGDDSDLRFAFAAKFYRARLPRHNSDPLVRSRVVVFFVMLLAEANISAKLVTARNLNQSALLHKYLHESVNFMIDVRGLQHRIFFGGPLLDFSILEEKYSN